MQQQLSEVSGKKEAPKMNCHEGWNDYAPGNLVCRGSEQLVV
jgi:hypothetical protein